MGSRMTGEGAEKVYDAAQKWVDCALRTDGSLFTPGEAIWTPGNLSVLHEKFLDKPDETKRDFLVKLQEQLSGSPPEVYQLMGEVLYAHYLIQDLTIGTKQNRIQAVLGWSSTAVSIPQPLVAGLQGRFVNTSAGQTYIPYQVGTLIETVEQWKELEPAKRDQLLLDPWAYKEFIFTRHFNSKLLVNNQDTGNLEKHLLLHIVHPDRFEAMLRDDKESLVKAKAFRCFVTEQAEDTDRKIKQIRGELEKRLGKAFSFYEDAIRQYWKGNPWDIFVALANVYVDSGRLEIEENKYKFEIADKLNAVRDAVHLNSDNWREVLMVALKSANGNPIDWRVHDNFSTWCGDKSGLDISVLEKIWAQDKSPVAERIHTFNSILPQSVIRGAGTRMNVMSVLLMGLDLSNYPPFRYRMLNDLYRWTGYESPKSDADEASLYEHSLSFFDRLIEEAASRGVTLRHRLDAQGVAWSVFQGVVLDNSLYVTPPPPVPRDPWSKENVDKLAKDLMWEPSDVQSIISGLEDKGQVIFQGPRGTGKTFVAKRIGEWAKEHRGDYKIVQFHPSYSYEDFVEGYRPTLSGNQAGFELRDGPLKEIADKADKKSDAKFILVIDEINRTNVSKVMGELYFLLEYREDKAPLLYSKEDFNLPKNLWFIGTMNTTDRSIALVDAALRRRFYFYDFFPDKPPIEGLLRKWLEKNDPDNIGIADLVDRANKELRDRHLSIGPSHFMKKEKLTEDKVRFIWERAVFPYIEGQLFDDDGKLEQFRFEKLKPILEGKNIASAPGSSEQDNGSNQKNGQC